YAWPAGEPPLRLRNLSRWPHNGSRVGACGYPARLTGSQALSLGNNGSRTSPAKSHRVRVLPTRSRASIRLVRKEAPTRGCNEGGLRRRCLADVSRAKVGWNTEQLRDTTSVS